MPEQDDFSFFAIEDIVFSVMQNLDDDIYLESVVKKKYSLEECLVKGEEENVELTVDIWDERSARFVLSGLGLQPYYTYNTSDDFLNTKEYMWNIEFSDELTQENYRLSLYCLNDAPGNIAFATLDEMRCEMLHEQNRNTLMTMPAVQVYMTHTDEEIVFAVLIPESVDFNFDRMGSCVVDVKGGEGQLFWKHFSRDEYLSTAE